MKIIKTAAQAQQNEMNRKIANEGCDECPECHARNWDPRIHDFIYVYPKLKRIITPNFFSRSNQSEEIRVYVDSYRCLECGAEWESEEYEEQ